jgi:hypothetical protein
MKTSHVFRLDGGSFRMKGQLWTVVLANSIEFGE